MTAKASSVLRLPIAVLRAASGRAQFLIYHIALSFSPGAVPLVSFKMKPQQSGNGQINHFVAGKKNIHSNTAHFSVRQAFLALYCQPRKTVVNKKSH